MRTLVNMSQCTPPILYSSSVLVLPNTFQWPGFFGLGVNKKVNETKLCSGPASPVRMSEQSICKIQIYRNEIC